MRKHHFGPWEIRHMHFSKDILDANKRLIAEVRDMRDARLIRAAPDLLEALEALAENYSDVEPGGSVNVDRARAAIAKARGKS